MLVKPRPEILQNRFFLLETQLFPLFIITGILFVNGVFHGKQPIAVLDSLYCRLAVASYVISVRRTKSSLTASFRFYLTIDTLAVQLYTSLSPRRVRDFHPLERAHGAQTKIPCQLSPAGLIRIFTCKGLPALSAELHLALVPEEVHL